MNERVDNLVNMLLEENLTEQCAWCRRIKQPDGSYAQGTPQGAVTHGICPECGDKVKADMERDHPRPAAPPKASFYPSMGGPSNA